MKEQKKIPTGKVKRAAKYLATGARVGRNYAGHYAKKIWSGSADEHELHQKNAQDIFDSLSELKGSALKVAQMLSLDSNSLPTEYLTKFAEAQYSTPPLSFPLVVSTFRKSFGTGPLSFFDSFTKNAVNAASIGQVHRATKDGINLAVKIQYPGVSESVKSDLKVAAMVAKSVVKLNSAEIDLYLEEVEQRLMEETDYQHELNRSIELSSLCGNLENVQFPKYFPEWSSSTILTMEWMDGVHLGDFIDQLPDQDLKNQVGQALWDFYQFQIHNLKTLHADPHPGNFIIQNDGTVAVIDFGCTKQLPVDFYDSYFRLLDPSSFRVHKNRNQLFKELGFIHDEDSEAERQFFTESITETIELLGRPFYQSSFDFSDADYFRKIYELGEKLSRSPVLRNSKQARGSKHGLYLNRTYFGLYNLLHQLGAEINTRKYLPQINLAKTG